LFACKNERVLRIKKIKPLILALLVLFSQTHKLRLELVIDALRKTKNKNKTEESLLLCCFSAISPPYQQTPFTKTKKSAENKNPEGAPIATRSALYSRSCFRF